MILGRSPTSLGCAQSGARFARRLALEQSLECVDPHAADERSGNRKAPDHIVPPVQPVSRSRILESAHAGSAGPTLRRYVRENSHAARELTGSAVDVKRGAALVARIGRRKGEREGILARPKRLC